MITDSGLIRRSLRRYNTARANDGRGHYHTAQIFLDEVLSSRYLEKDPKIYSGYPTRCDCGYKFADSDQWQVFTEHLYDGGPERTTLRDAPVGAMYDATWTHYPPYQGSDGVSLHVIVPDDPATGTKHPWCVDGRASNCDMKSDFVHKCWVRHGVPPDVTVDKCGVTCGAGAGSIQTSGWHGFLVGGWLREDRG